MSYPYNQQGGPPPQGYNQWQQPPPNQPYGAPPPQQGGWNQSAPPPQQGWNAPHGGQQPQYPPSNQQYPPQQGYGAPPPQFNQQYPPSAPQGQYGAPQQGYGAPPPQFNQQQPPYNQQQQYGQQPPYGQQQPQYPQQGYQAPAGGYGQPTGPPAPPSPGYAPGTHINYDASRDVDAIKKACKGFGTDEKALIAALVKLDPLQIEAVNARFAQGERKPLIKLIDDETSGAFQEGLIMIARGPLHLDTWLLYRATKGAGTKEVYLNDVLLGRRNADIQAIKTAYQKEYGVPLEQVLRADLSGKDERLFDMALAARRTEESVQPNPGTVANDAQLLHSATEGQMGTNEIEVCRILTSRNDNELRAIASEFEKMYQISLEKVIMKEFSGDMENSLLYILRSATNKAKRDAQLIDRTMRGVGTKEEELSSRLVRAHWTPGHIVAVKREYQALTRKDLVNDIKSETSGDYERLLVALAS